MTKWQKFFLPVFANNKTIFSLRFFFPFTHIARGGVQMSLISITFTRKIADIQSKLFISDAKQKIYVFWGQM